MIIPEVFDNIKKAIEKTGFPLEYQVSKILQKRGWMVINNRYYIDDVEDSPREMDVLAYKVKSIDGINLYLTLLISCKKNDDNAWVFCVRDVTNDYKINVNVSPDSFWTNVPELEFINDQSSIGAKIMDAAGNNGVANGAFRINMQYLASQEVSLAKGAPHNDKAIFNSISGLMKAEYFEKTHLEKRKKEPSIYIFNLITIVDLRLFEYDFSDEKNPVSEKSDVTYVYSFIINKAQSASRIRFSKINDFLKVLDDYDQMQKIAISEIGQMLKKFYDGIFSDYKRMSVVSKQVHPIISDIINTSLRLYGDKKVRYLFYSLTGDCSCLKIEVVADGLTAEILEKLSDNSKVQIAEMIKKYFRYEGAISYVFCDDAPPF